MNWKNEECRILLTLASKLGYNTVSDLAKLVRQVKKNNSIKGLNNV